MSEHRAPSRRISVDDKRGLTIRHTFVRRVTSPHPAANLGVDILGGHARHVLSKYAIILLRT